MPAVVAPLAAIIIAIVALIALYAFYQLFHPLLQGLGDQGGTVGGLLARAADQVLVAAYHYAFNWARSAVEAIIGFILAPVFWVEAHIKALTHAVASLIWAQQWLASVYIPRQINGALTTASGWVHDAEVLSAAEFGQAESYALTLYHDAIAFTSDGLTRVTDYAQTLYHDAINYTDTRVNGAEAYALSLYHNAISFTQAGLAEAEHYTTVSVAGVESWTAGQITALDKYIAATGVAAYAYADARVAEVEGELGRLKTDCTDNLCSGLSDLASLFNGLSSAWSIGTFVELIAEAMHNPHGAAAMLDTVVGAPARALTSTLVGQAGG